MRRTSGPDYRMRRYATSPLGDGAYGGCDRERQEFIQACKGRGARQRAERKWRKLAGVG
jgi:hypothetical protein